MKEILDYITNNITENTGENIPQYPTPVVVNNNVFNDLTRLLNATSFLVLGSLYNEMNQNTIFYGHYNITGTYYGFVYIVDANMEEVQLITTFTSGTKLFPILSMHQDENNYMYALSFDFEEPATSRILLLNNIFGSLNNEYSVVLRQSYIIPNGKYYRFTPSYSQRITKAPGEATYYIVCSSLSSKTVIIELKINVGSENEWNTFILGERYDNTMFDTQFEKKGDTTTFYYYGVSNTTPEIFTQYSIKDSTLTIVNELTLPTASSYLSSQVFCKNKDEVYYSVLDEEGVNTYNRIYKIEKNIIKKIYEKLTTSTSFYDWIYFKQINNIIFFQHTYGTNNVYETELGIMKDDVLYFTDPISIINGNPLNVWALTNINVSYNLIMIYVPGTTNTSQLKFEYNPNNYNGQNYISYNELVPRKTRLYSNNDLVFARNLYNITLNNGTMTATVQIPNTLLNNITLNKEELIGETNATLISKTESIAKNIYETLYINFIRSLAVKDEDTSTYYPTTATYINQNINTGTKQNCEMSFVGKVRINYQDNIIIQTLEWNYNDDHYETSFVIDTHNEIPTSVDFMSNDETTIYITKDLTLDSNKYYKLNQKLRIE